MNAIELAEECQDGYPLAPDAIAAAKMLRRQYEEIQRLKDRLEAAEKALAEPAGEPVGDGWQLRHVYFQDGEPTMHKAPPAEVPLLSDAEVGMLTVYGGLHHVDVPLLAEFVRHIESTIRRKAGLK